MNKILILGLVIVLVSVGLVGCTENNIINPPNIEIISKSARTGYENLDFAVYIDTTLYNKGGDGSVTIWAKVTQGTNYWTEKQTVFLNNEETKSLTFSFPEVSFWDTSQSTYSVWIE
jgi:hypothetical protein